MTERIVAGFSGAIKLRFRVARGMLPRILQSPAFSPFGCGWIRVPAFGTAAILVHWASTCAVPPDYAEVRGLTSPARTGMKIVEARPLPVEAMRSMTWRYQFRTFRCDDQFDRRPCSI